MSYGPTINAVAILLSSQGNVPVEAAAELMAAILGVNVSTGFVARAHERFADLLAQGGFDEAMIAALRAKAVLCADETPRNVVDDVSSTVSRLTGRRTWSPCAPPSPDWFSTRTSTHAPRNSWPGWASSKATAASWCRALRRLAPVRRDPERGGCSVERI